MNKVQIKKHIESLKKTIEYLEAFIVEENVVVPTNVVIPPKKQINKIYNNSWKDALRRVATLFKDKNLTVRVPDLTRFMKELKKKKPLSEYSDDEIIKKKFWNDAVRRVAKLFDINEIKYSHSELKLFLKDLKKTKPLSQYTDSEILLLKSNM